MEHHSSWSADPTWDGKGLSPIHPLDELLEELRANSEKGEEWSVTMRKCPQGGFTATSEVYDRNDLNPMPRYVVGHGDTTDAAVRALEEKLKLNCYL